MKRKMEESDESFEFFLLNYGTSILMEIFKYNPYGLVSLSRANKKFYTKFMVENGFWYYICKFSFPHVSIYADTKLKEINEKCNYKINTGNISNDINLLLLSINLFGDDLESYNIVFNNEKRNLFVDLIKNPNKMNKEIGLKYLEIFNTPKNTLECSGDLILKNIDQSFIDKKLLNQCQENGFRAINLLKAFKCIYPLGIPPAEYCTTFHMDLRKFTKQWIYIVLEHGNQKTTLLLLKTLHKIIRGYSMFSFNADIDSFINSKLP